MVHGWHTERLFRPLHIVNIRYYSRVVGALTSTKEILVPWSCVPFDSLLELMPRPRRSAPPSIYTPPPTCYHFQVQSYAFPGHGLPNLSGLGVTVSLLRCFGNCVVFSADVKYLRCGTMSGCRPKSIRNTYQATVTHRPHKTTQNLADILSTHAAPRRTEF